MNFNEQPGRNSNQYADSQPPVVFIPPKPVSNRLLWILLGTLACAFLLCGGFIVMVAVSFRSPSKMTADYQEQRAPINGLPSESMTSVLVSPAPVDSRDAEAIQLLIDAIAQEDPNPGEYTDQRQFWHMPRFVTEMQNSGEAVGVNGWTRLVWVKNLEDSVSLPTLSEDSIIIGIEPLKSPDEARVTVVSYWPGHEQPIVNWLYVIKTDGEWKLFDYRDVLDPASEAQYFALYSAASDRLAENYSRLTYDNSEIYGDYESDSANKAQRTLAAFKKRKYPAKILPLAQNHTASFLVLYEQVDPLEEVVMQMDPQQILGYYYYKAQLELIRGDQQAAFEASQALMERLGWHPVAALTAAEAAVTDEQQQLAAGWLLKSLRVMPEHDVTLQSFLELADGQQIQALAQQLGDRPQPVSAFMGLLETLRYLPQSAEALEDLQEAANSIDALRPALPYCQLIQAETESQPEMVLEQAAKLLQEPAVAEQHDALWQTFMRYAFEDGMLDVADRWAPDRERFLRSLRDRLLSRWELDVDWERAEALLRSAPADSLLLDEAETKVVLARIMNQLGRSDEAYRLCLELLQAEASWFDSDDPPEHLTTLLDVASRSATASGQLLDFVDQAPDREIAFLVSAGQLLEQHEGEALSGLLEWAAGHEALSQIWQQYYAAQLAYDRGEWAEADAALAELTAAVENDMEFLDGQAGLVIEFCPDLDPGTLVSLRAEVAFRCGQLPAFVGKAIDEAVDLEELAYEVDWQLEDTGAAHVSEEIGQRFLDGPPALHATGYALLAEAKLSAGQWEPAIDSLLQSAQLEHAEAAYYNAALEDALRWMLAYGRYERLPELSDLAEDSDAAQTDRFALAKHCASGDSAALLETLKLMDADYAVSDWVSDPAHLIAMQRAEVWEPVNAEYAVSVSSVAYANQAHAALFFEVPLSSIFEELVAGFSERLANLRQLPRERFPGAVEVWEADLMTPAALSGSVLLIGYDGLPEGVVKESDYAGRIREYPGVLCVSLRMEGGIVPGTRELRQLCATAGPELPGCLGYNDYMADAWFLGEGWHRKLASAVESGVNVEHPRPDYVSWRKATSLEMFRISEGQPVLQLPLFLAVEQIPITPMDDTGTAASENTWTDADGATALDLQGGVARLEADAYSTPFLRKGTRVREDYGY